MPGLSNKKRVILAKLEPTAGVSIAASLIATDGVLCSNLALNPLEGAIAERNVIRPYFGSAGSSRAESYVTLSFDTELAGGSGLRCTPQWEALIMACGFSSTKSNALGAGVSGVAAADRVAQIAGSATVSLAALVNIPSLGNMAGGAVSAVTGFYNGYNISVGGQVCGTITAYDGTTKIATVSGAVPATVAGTTTVDIYSGYAQTGGAIISSVVAAAQTAGASVAVLAASASTVDNYYVGWTIQVGQQVVGTVTGYVGATKTATLSATVTAAQTSGTTAYNLINGTVLSGVVATAQTAGASVAVLAASASTSDGYYVGCLIRVGTQTVGTVTAYNGATKTATLSAPVTLAQTSGTTTYDLIGVFDNTNTTLKLASNSAFTDDQYVGQTLISVTLASGLSAGIPASIIETREIIAYNSQTRVVTLNAPLNTSANPSTIYNLTGSTAYTLNSDIASASNSSATFVVNIDGQNHILYGARGTFSIDMTIKQFPVMKWTFTGLLGDISALPQIIGDFTAWEAPVVVSSTNTNQFNLVGASPSFSKLSIDMGNAVVHRQLIGSELCVISDRKIKGSITIDATSSSLVTYYMGVIRSDTPAQFYVRHGNKLADYVSIWAPLCQIGQPKYSEQDNMVMLDFSLDFQPKLTAALTGGNNEIRIVCK